MDEEEVPFDWVGVLNFDEFNWDDVDDRKFINDAVAVIDVVDDLTAYLVIHDIEEDKINAVFVIGVFE